MVYIGDGYRLLAGKENILGTDEWRFPNSEKWELDELYAGTPVSNQPSFTWRRKIRVQSPGYRWLDEGEIKPTTSQRQNSDKKSWAKSCLVGISAGRPNSYRVPIEPCQVAHYTKGENYCQVCGVATEPTHLPESVREAFSKEPIQKQDLSVPVKCGCKRHDIDPGGDIYAQHREWSRDLDSWGIHGECAQGSGVVDLHGVGVSKPIIQAGFEEQYGLEFEQWQ